MNSITKTRRQDIVFSLLKNKDADSALSIAMICDLLENEGIKVHVKTVNRDINDLSKTHGLMETDTIPNRFYPSKDFQHAHEIHLNDATLQVLMIALNNLKHTSHNYFYNVSTEAETAILNSLDIKTAAPLRSSKERYHFNFSTGGKPTTSDLADFENIMLAIRENKVITCKNISPYKGDDYNARIRSFAPYVFLLVTGVPYLIVQDQENSEFRTLRVQRIKEVELSKESFERIDITSKYDLDMLVGGWGATGQEIVDITINCKEIMGTYFQEKIIHPSQKVQKISDDHFEINFKCPASMSLIRLVSSFGGQVMSVSPRPVYDEVKEIWEAGLRSVA